MTAAIEPGTVLAGKFRIDQILGQGGMGVVVAAHHLHLDEQVAIKFLLPQALSNPDAVARFAQEARASVKIKSEHVARVSDVGMLESGAPYIVMERLIGSDLGAIIAQLGRLPVEDAVDYVLQASEAVAEAHALGIVHRDLKPSNLFLVHRADGSPCIKVLDFGISKMMGPGGLQPDGGLTMSSVAMGSPNYMSPEQLTSSRDVDTRTDIWALGVILYELLCGHPPFRATSFAELCTKVLSTAPEPLSVANPEIPPALEEAVHAALEKDRGRRLPTVSELAQRIVVFAPKRARISAERISKVLQAAGLSGTALVLPPSSEPTPAQAGTIGGLGQTVSNKRQGALWAIGVGAVVLVGGALALSQLWAKGVPSPSAVVNASPSVPMAPATPSETAAVESASSRPQTAEVEPTVEPAPSATSAPATAAPPVSASPRSEVRPKAKQPPSSAASAAQPPKQPAKKNCTPNYYFDKQGEKHFKPECF